MHGSIVHEPRSNVRTATTVLVWRARSDDAPCREAVRPAEPYERQPRSNPLLPTQQLDVY
jgi:hypothetical protein